MACKTLITQEMQAKGYLAGNSVYACTAHSPEIISKFFEELDSVFGLIKECEEGRDVMSLLNGPECHSGFKRLNEACKRTWSRAQEHCSFWLPNNEGQY